MRVEGHEITKVDLNLVRGLHYCDLFGCTARDLKAKEEENKQLPGFMYNDQTPTFSFSVCV